MSASCPTCNTHQRKFYCTDCLRSHLHQFRNATQRAESERDGQVEKAKKALTLIDKRRGLRADAAKLEQSIAEVTEWRGVVERSCDDLRARITRSRENIRRRRENLSNALQIKESAQEASTSIDSEATIEERIAKMTEAVAQSHAALARTRRVLIRELVQVFDVREATPSSTSHAQPSTASPMPFGVGSVLGTFSRKPKSSQPPLSALSHSYHATSRPFPSTSSSSSSSRSSTPYSIATLTLPSNPVKLQRLPPEHVQAVIQYLLQFMRLLTFYMGVKVPFEIIWDGGAGEGVGSPWIHAIKGTDEGGWAKYSAAQPLHPPPPPTTSSPSSSSFKPTIRQDYATSALSSSSSSSPARLIPSFTTGLAMLNYNIAYVLYTQGIRVPSPLHPTPTPPPDALRNLAMLCFSPLDSVGLYSHDAMSFPYRLAPPTGGVRPPASSLVPPGTKGDKFDVEFGDMLRVMHAAMGNRGSSSGPKVRRTSGGGAGGGGTGGEEDWDLVGVEEALIEEDEEEEKDEGDEDTVVPLARAAAAGRPVSMQQVRTTTTPAPAVGQLARVGRMRRVLSLHGR